MEPSFSIRNFNSKKPNGMHICIYIVTIMVYRIVAYICKSEHHIIQFKYSQSFIELSIQSQISALFDINDVSTVPCIIHSICHELLAFFRIYLIFSCLLIRYHSNAYIVYRYKYIVRESKRRRQQKGRQTERTHTHTHQSKLQRHIFVDAV